MDKPNKHPYEGCAESFEEESADFFWVYNKKMIILGESNTQLRTEKRPSWIKPGLSHLPN
jgi:hypothetical protein